MHMVVFVTLMKSG